MSITERIVNTKRHTIGFVVDGRELTRKQAVKAAKKGVIANVRVVHTDFYGPHLVSIGRKSLYTLPTRFPVSHGLANKKRSR